MDKKISFWQLRYAILLSILLHCLLLLSVLIGLPNQKHPTPPHHYLPSYIYKGSILPAPLTQAHKGKNHTPIEAPKTNNEPTPSSAKQEQSITHDKGLFQKPLLMPSDVLRQEQIARAINQTEEREPILLIGDKNHPADPLIKLMGRALSAHFTYPHLEGNMGLKGRVVIEMVLHPEGYFSDVHIVQSSENQNFDSAALYAVNTAPTVQGADRFLKEPKYFIVGFIFR